MSELIDIETFPTTRYQGSKRKILDWLNENLRDIEFQTVLDACGGTGSVSYLFKKMGKSVTYNDVLKFNSLSGKALIENQNIKITTDDLEFILNFDGLEENGFIKSTFGGVYFTDKENIWLDNVIRRINVLPGVDESETAYKKAICFNALFQTSLRKRPFNLFHRKNLDIRLNDVKRNFGNKTTWERDFELDFRSFISEINESIFDSGIDCFALNKSIFDLENENYDMVYLDPPYVSGSGDNETNNYLNCYHFLEGMTDYENWGDKIDYKTKNLRFKAQPNPFDKRRIYDSLNLLFQTFQDSILVLSYKIGGTPSVEEIMELMGRYKENVTKKSKHYKYALNKQNGNAKHNREVLIIGR
ncbi:DNA adenine methylase [Maribacter sp. 2210JD10-5]|uniref:DNA adenine methylase n=1 Tax=Maribacter sp. 2210JD10-5 TaxID=3386272 RepID=UPI0039BD228D